MESSPFSDLKIDDSSFLDDVEGRSKCTKCGRSRKFYCYTCLIPTGSAANKYPNLKLPLKVDVIKHPNETDGKSTAIHAAILAPDSVNIYTFPCIPNYPEKDKVLLVCPGPGAIFMEDLYKKYGEICNGYLTQTEDSPLPHKNGAHVENEENQHNMLLRNEDTLDPTWMSSSSSSSVSPESLTLPSDTCLLKRKSCEHNDSQDNKRLRRRKELFHTVVFIDSTWQQLNKIASDIRLSGLQKVEMRSQKTKFWRHQTDKPDSYLATIEAIYYFFNEFHQNFIDDSYCGEYDNLLFFFNYFYKQIKVLHDQGKPVKAFDRKKCK